MSRLTVSDKFNINMAINFRLGLSRFGTEIFPQDFYDRKDVRNYISQRLTILKQIGYISFDNTDEAVDEMIKVLKVRRQRVRIDNGKE